MGAESYIMEIVRGNSLARRDAEKLMDSLISDEATEIMKAAFLTGLYFKGASTEEIIGFSRSLMKHATATRIPGLTDIVGTGGDGKNTINVSTASSIAASALGIRVSKHGNTGITSSHGSADFMKYIGYDLDRGVRNPTETLEKDSFLYVFAPLFNRSFALFSSVRKKIGHRTVFNMMGPITNPFDPDFVVIGTADESSARPYAEVLSGRSKKGFVLHSSDGLDEISPSAETRGFVVNGTVREISIDPEEITGRRIDLSGVITADPRECFTRTLRGLSGKDADSSLFIALNTAPALLINGLAHSLREGYEIAHSAIMDGTVREHMKRLTSGREEFNEAA